LNIEDILISVILPSFIEKERKLTSLERIGPHDKNVLSIIIGSILGDTHLEKRKKGLGTRIIFEQSHKNVEYLMWFHNYFSIRGYCNPKTPKLHLRIKKDNKVYYHYRVTSYTFSSLN
jgi:ubiquinol-cytochrome c reductase cytochrome b subunit